MALRILRIRFAAALRSLLGRLALRGDGFAAELGCRLREDAGIPCPKRLDLTWISNSISSGAYYHRL